MSFNLKNYLYPVSCLLIFEGFSFLLCIPWAIYFQESLMPFCLPAFLISGCGLLLFYFSKPAKLNSIKDGVVLLSVAWFIAIFCGSLPFLINGGISLIDVLFETTSGFTSTGSSVLKNPQNLPKSIIFWRSLSQWIGGLGTLFSLAYIFPLLNIGGYRTLSFEPVLKKQTPLTAREIARAFVSIYLVVTAVLVISIVSGGLDLFNGLSFAFSIVSTGGFFPDTDNSSALFSPFLQYVIIVFMLSSGGNYFSYFLFFGKKKPILKYHTELRNYLIILLLFTCFVVLLLPPGEHIEQAFRKGFFWVTSFMTTSGYSPSAFHDLPDYLKMILILLLFIGGCTASLSGGVKVGRLLIFIKSIKKLLKNYDNPVGINEVAYGSQTVGKQVVLSVLTFIVFFLLIFLIGTLLLSALGFNMAKAALLSVSALSNFRIPYSLLSIHNASKLILCLMMVAGKLQIYPLLLIFSPWFYRQRRNELTVDLDPEKLKADNEVPNL